MFQTQLNMLRLLLISIFVCLSLSVTSLAQSKHRAKGKSKPVFVSCGVCNSKAIYLPKPPYPAAARAIRAYGRVNVSVKIDEKGRVYWAKAVSGHMFFWPDSEKAARQARFEPFRLGRRAVRVIGTIVYNFVLD
jgi:TonB family protein